MPGTAGIGDLPGSSSCIIEEVGFLIAQELQASPGKPQQPQREGLALSRACSTSVLAELPGVATAARLPPRKAPSRLASTVPWGGSHLQADPAGAAAVAGEAGGRLTFMQGQEQGQSEGAPGSGHGDHSGGGAHRLDQRRARACCQSCCQAEPRAHCLSALAASYNTSHGPAPAHPALPRSQESDDTASVGVRLPRCAGEGGRWQRRVEAGGKAPLVPLHCSPQGPLPVLLRCLKSSPTCPDPPSSLSMRLLPGSCPELRVGRGRSMSKTLLLLGGDPAIPPAHCQPG